MVQRLMPWRGPFFDVAIALGEFGLNNGLFGFAEGACVEDGLSGALLSGRGRVAVLDGMQVKDAEP